MSDNVVGQTIERFFPGLIQINDLKLDMKNKEAIALLEKTTEEFLGIPIQQIEQMDPPALIEQTGGSGPDRVARLMIGSHLLKEMGDFYIYNGERAKSEQQFFNSLVLFVQVYKEDPGFDFTRHFPILPELNNRVARERITQEMADAVNAIHDGIYE